MGSDGMTPKRLIAAAHIANEADRYLVFDGMAEAYEEQKTAAAQVNGEQLTSKLREPGKNINQASGLLERESPLFRGTGENPLLF
jgi:hypothetical protein